MNNLIQNTSVQYSKVERRLPDFVIAGAMKCGTSSLHKILATHPDIFIPNKEIHFLDLDDIKQHPDFFINNKGQWYYPRFEQNWNNYIDKYMSYFENAKPHQIIGEDSTTYMASDKTAARLANINPEVKVIIMMRDPASRTYSHYWHTVRSGRALFSFEDTLQIMPDNLIHRSLYKKQIENFLQHIPRQNMHFILFEEFVKDMQHHINEVCAFLGVSAQAINLENVKTHANKAKIPKHIQLQLWRNRIFRLKAKRSNMDLLAATTKPEANKAGKITQYVDHLHRKVNPLQKSKTPPMDTSTRKFLNNYFREENKELGDLINKDIASAWYRV